MNTFLKAVGVVALCLVGGCIALGVIGGLAAKKVANDPEFQKAVEQANEQIQKTAEPPAVTLAEFNQIQNGMTYQEVVRIVGAEGTLQSENTIGGHNAMYAWQNASAFDGGMNAMFQNEKLIQKSQFGLK